MALRSLGYALRGLAVFALRVLLLAPLTVLAAVLLYLRPLFLTLVGFALLGGLGAGVAFGLGHHYADAASGFAVAVGAVFLAALYEGFLQLAAPGWERFAPRVEYRELH